MRYCVRCSGSGMKTTSSSNEIAPSTPKGEATPVPPSSSSSSPSSSAGIVSPRKDNPNAGSPNSTGSAPNTDRTFSFWFCNWRK